MGFLWVSTSFTYPNNLDTTRGKATDQMKTLFKKGHKFFVLPTASIETKEITLREVYFKPIAIISLSLGTIYLLFNTRQEPPVQ